MCTAVSVVYTHLEDYVGGVNVGERGGKHIGNTLLAHW